MDDDSIQKFIVTIIIIAILLFISANFTKCVVESDLPLWTKIWLLN